MCGILQVWWLALMGKIKETILSAAHIYCEYLCENQLGLSEIGIIGYECIDSELILALKHNVGDIDVKLGAELLLLIEEQWYTIAEDGDITLHFYDQKAKKLYLSFNDEMSIKLKKAQDNKIDIHLFSDLKFLVKNVECFFKKYGDSVCLPEPIVRNTTHHIQRLSQEQNLALYKVLNNSLSYVWGPPGTGKTQAVLFEALLYYINHGKRVAVVATTNNALEQVLKTLIKQFDVLGLERDNILRLGTPTLQYMNDYPQTCEPNIVRKNNETSLFDFQDTLINRLKHAFVVGVTLDGFIKRYDSLELHFAHIFLDECAYAPLIKVCALCVDNTPITFFGDHKQLSPVCEMPSKELAKPQNNNAYIWNLCALFLESFCNGESPSALALLNERCDMPPLSETVLSILSQTHRYGNNLAKILDTYIYHMGLSGTQADMELFMCDSGAKQEEDKHISWQEVKTCKYLCAKLAGEDYAVITPFAKQKRLLLRNVSANRVFTIHTSQGQEFDNVIFSPVSLHYHLTDSMRIQALYALNVAISRAKKRLFIVCDYMFWSRQKGQLIWAILQEAKPFTF